MPYSVAVGISVEPQTMAGKYEIKYKCLFYKSDKEHYTTSSIPALSLTAPFPLTPQKSKQTKTTPKPQNNHTKPNQKQKPNKKETGHIFMENLASPSSQPLEMKDALHPSLMIFSAICVFPLFLVSEYSANWR